MVLKVQISQLRISNKGINAAEKLVTRQQRHLELLSFQPQFRLVLQSTIGKN